ncbi:glycosyltransferase family 4 protein [Carboxydochorda subterranea]|uniref:Glycosyltransferase family 4 protein n=1 Tax=Carboxydichorda subterranea TaxID=3109565 RepID=A0ABZ1C208_9FIRM|nr:glycosyltransferase family 4 protein [Limnochorda sp. L945t]WRP18826.1 glycosyltransferase family 4 protein [Limnochorda sp. L945t]
MKVSRVNIAYVITRSDSVGGAHVHVRDLSIHLLGKGHQVTVLAGGQGPFTQELRDQGIPHRSLRYLARSICPSRDVRGILELRRELSALMPDIVSTHSSKAGWLGRLAAKSLGLPVLFTAHGWAFTEGVAKRERRFYAFAERLAGPFADRIITVSEHDRQLALAYRVAPPKQVVTIHNGVPDVPLALRARPERQPPRLVMIARFEPQKAHSALLSAIAGLADLSWELEFIGDGPLLEAVKAQVNGLGLEQRVRFLGARKDVAERLAGAQVFVLISNWEGLPRTILEAMRAGLPVVASDVGGVHEAVMEGETGFLVPRGQVGALRERLLRLIRVPDLRIQMGRSGRARYEHYFTFERMYHETMAVYQEVLAARRQRSKP